LANSKALVTIKRTQLGQKVRQMVKTDQSGHTEHKRMPSEV